MNIAEEMKATTRAHVNNIEGVCFVSHHALNDWSEKVKELLKLSSDLIQMYDQANTGGVLKASAPGRGELLQEAVDELRECLWEKHHVRAILSPYSK